MRSTYKKEDVELLLKDITGLVEPQTTKVRERLIQKGRHYCEMLPIEYSPSEIYLQAYYESLNLFSKPTAQAVGNLADKIMKCKGEKVVLVSLARAGIPIGILLKRYIKWKYKEDIKHYSISIIRGKGIDKNAMNYLLSKHKPKDLLFVDGWIGKGAILRELEKATAEFKGVSSKLAVLADPANITDLCGTHEDILIPSSCLNCTVSGLISRTFLRSDIIGKDDFHGAVFYEDLINQDLSYEFIEKIEKDFLSDNEKDAIILQQQGIDEVKEIRNKYSIDDINLIKPGIGETTRVLLRRVPWKVLISDQCKNDIALAPIIRLAEEKKVEVEYYPLRNYKASGIIKKLADA
ncbi:RNA binding Pelota-like protein [Lachnotalea glycerini]|jgi:hypothetical protein|uniref:RNA binding Pelota-like protein n=1 Tax=Lachnotalea glycerini TaxID=1763509 RepID=A0A255IR97_9FIRM|nr:cysteine protease StiP family protein [Lachnotalea glycerini]PXV93411.1 RNA binding Pelota-like protein [Lachnotalea glycerini]RDY31870.1 hypothetical protein CG710_007755 [Lachnotalea glycerini]